MAKVIIGIHGLANKPDRVTQKDCWMKSISEGLEKNCGMNAPNFNLECVYWADLLYKYSLHNDKDFSFDSLYDKEPYIPAKPGALKKYKDNWLDRMRSDVQSALGNVVDGAKTVFGMDTIAHFFLARIVRDLDFYYDDNRQIRDRNQKPGLARKVLQEELSAALLTYKTDDILLIGHSMGSIIAYDVLRNLGNPDQGLRVSHFVTIGSPLGLPTVKQRVAKERAYDPSVRTPTIVTRSWVNFADRKDPVAFDTHLQDDYAPNGSGITVRDDLILNDYESNGKHNPHKLFGYLRAPEVSEHIRDFLLP